MATNKAEYRLAPKAKDDMEVLWLWSLMEWGRARTERYVDTLIAAFGFLAESPNTGTPCDHIRAGYRRYPVNRRVSYYRTTEYGIEVIRVLHDRMLATRHL
ncbi:MAG: type II toxin-antitoxin system RelE/ParE family toxin [Pseudomonadales bacterium]|nr:type II toxin-antitoxin system RelE/ParE family toxin [Pseudomonadales bacterium]